MKLLRPKVLCRFATNKHSLISGNDKLSALRESLRLFMHHFLLKSKKEKDPVIKSRVESAENALLLSKNKNFWEINPAMKYLKSVHFKETVARSSFLSKLWYFLICIEKYHNFERNEDLATVFLKWTDFNC